MKKSILLPLATFLVSGVSFFLRKTQISAVKDPETLLYQANAGETMALMGVILLFLAVIGGLLFTGARTLPNHTYTVYCPNPLFAAAVATGSLILVLSMIIGLLDIKSGIDLAKTLGNEAKYQVNLMEIGKIALTTMAGGSLLLLGTKAYRGKELTDCWLTLIPASLAVLRLVMIYRDFGSTANVQDKIYPIFSAIFTTMALYHLCASTYTPPKPPLIVFYSLGAVVWNASYLAMGIAMFDVVSLVGLNIIFLAFSGAILENAYCSRENYRTPPPPEGDSYYTEKTENITNSIIQEDTES